MIFLLGALVMAALASLLIWLPLRALSILPKCLLLVLSLSATVILYAHLGALPAVYDWEKQKEIDDYYSNVMTHLGSTKESVIHTIKVLNQRLQEHPVESQGWYLLGQIALGVGDKQSAGFYLQRAHELLPENADYTDAVNALNQPSSISIKLINYEHMASQLATQHFRTLFIAIKQQGQAMPLWALKQSLDGKMPSELHLDAEHHALAGRFLPIQQPLSVTLRLSHGEQLDLTTPNTNDWILSKDFVISDKNQASIELLLDLSLIIIK